VTAKNKAAALAAALHEKEKRRLERRAPAKQTEFRFSLR